MSGLQIPLWTKGVSEPTIGANFSYSTTQDDNGDDVMNFTYKVFFAWGEAFDYKNPSLYFDEEPQYSTIPTGKPEDALSTGSVGAILADMHNLLDEVQLTLTLTANPD